METSFMRPSLVELMARTEYEPPKVLGKFRPGVVLPVTKSPKVQLSKVESFILNVDRLTTPQPLNMDKFVYPAEQSRGPAEFDLLKVEPVRIVIPDQKGAINGIAMRKMVQETGKLHCMLNLQDAQAIVKADSGVVVEAFVNSILFFWPSAFIGKYGDECVPYLGIAPDVPPFIGIAVLPYIELPAFCMGATYPGL